MNSLPSDFDMSAIRKFTALGQQTPGCILMTLGQSHLPPPQEVIQALGQAVETGKTGYSPNRGDPFLIDALCRWEQKPCNPENILITAGATGALYNAFSGLLQPGDEVLIFTPAYPVYATLAAIVGATPVFADTKIWNYQIGDISPYLSHKTRMVVLNSPCNPTGTVYSELSVKRLLEAVTDRPIYLLYDSAYYRLSETVFPETLLYSLGSRFLLCRSFSKTWAMTGFRCGYLVADADIIRRLTALQAAQISCLPPFIQTACAAALPLPPVCRYRQQREYGSLRLTQMGLPHPKPEGGFYLFPDMRQYTTDDTAFCLELLQQGGVAAVPGSAFGASGHIRLSCCCDMAVLQKGLCRLEKFLSRSSVTAPLPQWSESPDCPGISHQTGSAATD